MIDFIRGICVERFSPISVTSQIYPLFIRKIRLRFDACSWNLFATYVHFNDIYKIHFWIVYIMFNVNGSFIRNDFIIHKVESQSETTKRINKKHSISLLFKQNFEHAYLLSDLFFCFKQHTYFDVPHRLFCSESWVYHEENEIQKKQYWYFTHTVQYV